MKKLLLASILASATPAFAGPDFVAPSPRGSSLTASTGTAEIGPLDDVLFEHDSARLLPGSADQLTTIARWLRRHPQQQLVIAGHADAVGMTGYNEDLATRRAAIVRAHLIDRGVAPERLLVVAYGEDAESYGADPLERRVVLYTTVRPFAEIARASFARGARTAMWQTRDALVTERKTGRLGGASRTIVSRR